MQCCTQFLTALCHPGAGVSLKQRQLLMQIEW